MTDTRSSDGAIADVSSDAGQLLEHGVGTDLPHSLAPSPEYFFTFRISGFQRFRRSTASRQT